MGWPLQMSTDDGESYTCEPDSLITVLFHLRMCAIDFIFFSSSFDVEIADLVCVDIYIVLDGNV